MHPQTNHTHTRTGDTQASPGTAELDRLTMSTDPCSLLLCPNMALWKRRSSNSTLAAVAAAIVLTLTTALTTGANAAAVHGHMDLCKSYTRVCYDFTSQVGLAGWCMIKNMGGDSWLTDPAPDVCIYVRPPTQDGLRKSL